MWNELAQRERGDDMGVELRLLLVEDCEDDAELVCLQLAKAGYDVESRRVDTEEDFLVALEEPWDMIISDYQMPTFDGLRAFRLFKQRDLDTPFLFVSGALGEDRAVEAMRAGARDYLLKGHLARLGATVKRELAEAENRAARREVERTFEREQRQKAMAVEASGAGVFEYRVPHAPRDSYGSERFWQILGYDRPEGDAPLGEVPLDEWLLERVHSDDLTVVKRQLGELTSRRLERMHAELRIHHREQRWVDVALIAKVVKEADGRTTVVGVLLDLTAHRKLEIQLRQAQKMDAVGRLAGGVAHDFNNLLTAILSFGSFVLDELGDGDVLREDMQEVMDAARRAAKLTEQLLAFSRIKPVSPRVLSINRIVTEMDRMLRRLVGADVDLRTTLHPNVWHVRADENSLEQVLLNLCVNARDAMPEGGKLTIETANVEVSEEYGQAHGADVPEGDYVVLAVSDNGMGMETAVQRRIFEPFFTTKSGTRKGTGLGLATCYGIVKQAGGFIWVYSELGVGTIFRVYLPRVLEAADEVERPRHVATTGGNEVVLVAEDDDQVRRLAVRSLSRLGYQVLEARNGVEAVRAVGDHPSPIDILITDMIMPEMNGRQLAATLTERYPGMRVLFMSGYGPGAMAHQGALDPNVHLLQKPFTPDLLGRAVRETLDADSVNAEADQGADGEDPAR